MDESSLSQEDQEILDQLFEASVEALAAGSPIDIDALVGSHTHLRPHALRLLAIAQDVANVEAPRLPQRHHRIEGFTVLEEVGRGGMGIVFKARQEALGRIVALKVLAPALLVSARSRDRFVKEARALGRIHHPNIVAVYDVVVTDEVCAYAMEWIEGRTLAQALAPSEPRLEMAAIARIGAILARALATVHDLGLTHRDVKPSNVLLRGDATPVLSDFSLVHDRDQSSHTASGEFLGTAAFAAPEQLRGEHEQVGPRSDVYSLGATLYVALTGQVPFGSTSTAEILRRISAGTRTPLRHLNPAVPLDLETIIHKALEPIPQRRYPNALELALDLERMLRFEPILARPLGLLGRWQRWIERRPQLALALLCLLLSLALGLTVTIYLALGLARQGNDLLEAVGRERAARTAAEDSRTKAEAAEKVAEAERASQIEAFDFVRWVFRKGDASLGGRSDVTVRAALDQTSEDLLEGRLRYKPRAEFVIRMMVVENYLSVGQAKTAERLLGPALALARDIYGQDSRQVAEAAQMLGRAQRLLGRLAEAESSLREAVRIRRTMEGADRLYLAQSLNSLGIVLRHQRQFEAAERTYSESLTLYHGHFGEWNENVAMVLGALATLRSNLGRLTAAEGDQRRAVTILERVHAGKPHIDTAGAYFQLGLIRRAQGDASEGDCLLEEGLRMTLGLVGKTHRQSAEQAARLGAVLAQKQRTSEAEILLRDAIAAYSELGLTREALAQRLALADLLLQTRRPAAAVSTLFDTLGQAKEDFVRTRCLHRLGLAWIALERLPEAEAALFAAWSLQRQAPMGASLAGELASALASLYAAWPKVARDPWRQGLAAEWDQLAKQKGR